MNISEAEAAAVVGADLLAASQGARRWRSTRTAWRTPTERGIILADTKFEFGLTDGRASCILIDEMLTPDSSRFWPTDQYAPGGPQPSFDKQFVRDYLESIRWNKQPPVPSLPEEVVRAHRARSTSSLSAA